MSRVNKKDTKRVEAISLSLPDRFYIQNNENLSVEQISSDLGKPIDIVKNYMNTLIKKEKKSRSRKAFQSDTKKGVTAMTEAASMIADDAHRNYVTPEDINKAMVEGNHELVVDLKKRYEEQEKSSKDHIKNKYKTMIHYIKPIDDDTEVF